ncbi:MDIS1-interacting receptor like kinase 1-like [Citrus clementina]|uniref:MDIS1-interacting receptor like kinase 1-like n=1 Tax=Citrus clementina TaxID=85681 RepID=UPI000CED372F|nr:MDIS1-interacting receptor like kinase 1-like [Citrus x clementina]
MSDNNLYGNVPAWLGNLSSLDDIMMARNHLRGPIPLEFCQLNYLKILDLSENNISGILPSCSGHSFIQQVHLSKHMLHGPLEYGTFLNRSHILTLDLSYNSFSGYIPYWIGRLTYLRYLILANNNLEGEVPIQLSWSKELQLIDLSNNNLFVEIPSCLDNTSLHNNGYNDGSSASAFNRDVRGTYSAGSSTMEKEESLMFTTKETSYLYKGKPLNKMYGVDLSCNKLACEIPPQIVWLTITYQEKIPERTAQFTTFKEDSYEGNPLLCGKPLPDCDAATVPEASNEENDNSLIDKDSFYITFTSSYVIVILAIIGVLYVNPYWHHRWFYLIEKWMTSSFYCIVANLIPTRFYRACM